MIKQLYIATDISKRSALINGSNRLSLAQENVLPCLQFVRQNNLIHQDSTIVAMAALDLGGFGIGGWDLDR